MDDHNSLDVEAFRLPPDIRRAVERQGVAGGHNTDSTHQKPARAPAGTRRRGIYIKGPIPLGWWMRALQLNRSAIRAASMLLYLAGLRRTKKELVAGGKLLEEWGLGCRTTRYKAFRALEETGLIRVSKRAGQRPRISIVEPNESHQPD